MYLTESFHTPSLHLSLKKNAYKKRRHDIDTTKDTQFNLTKLSFQGSNPKQCTRNQAPLREILQIFQEHLLLV